MSLVLSAHGLIRQAFPHPLHPQAQSLLLLPGVCPGCMCRFHFHRYEELTHAQALVSKHEFITTFVADSVHALSDLLGFPLYHLVLSGQPRLPLQLLTLSTCSSANAAGTQVDCPWASCATVPPKYSPEHLFGAWFPCPILPLTVANKCRSVGAQGPASGGTTLSCAFTPGFPCGIRLMDLTWLTI